jgi:hypothetical protein
MELLAFLCADRVGFLVVLRKRESGERIDPLVVEYNAEPQRRTLNAMTRDVVTVKPRAPAAADLRNSEKAGSATSTTEVMKMASPSGISRNWYCL